MPKFFTAKQAATVRVWLAQHDKTQGWLARRMRVSPSMVSGVLAGQWRPSAEFLGRLASVTGVDVRHGSTVTDSAAEPEAAVSR